MTDSLTGHPIEAASFVLFKLKDSTIFNGSITGKNGEFTISNIPAGTYFARLSCIGYKTRRKNLIDFSSESKPVFLDTIRMTQSSIMLDGVKIISEKERIQYQEDKILVNVDRRMGNNAREMLESIPMVTVSIGGSISMMGVPGTRIFIDGQPSSMYGYSNMDDLKLLNINEIEKVELIQNPSLEFNIHSTGGVINIITRKVNYFRYSGIADAGLTTNNYLNTSIGSVLGYKNYSIRGRYKNEYSDTRTGNDSYKKININDSTRFINQNADYSNNINSNDFQLFSGISWPASQLVGQISYSNKYTDYDKDITNNINNDYEYLSNSFSRTRQKFLSLSAFYISNYKEWGVLTARVGLSNNLMRVSTNLAQKNSSIAGTYIQNSYSENHNNSYLWNVKYNVPWKWLKLQISYDGSSKNLEMNNHYDKYNERPEEFYENPRLFSWEKHNNITHQLLGGIEARIYGVKIGAGLGIDNNTTSRKDGISGIDRKENLTNLITESMARMNIFQNQNIVVSYSRLINYPQNRQLNPRVDNSDSTNIIIGNPDLKPSELNSFKLNYSLPIAGQYLSIDANYSLRKNIIGQITTQKNVQTSITTYKNIASAEVFSTGLSTYYTFSKNLNMGAGVNYGMDRYKGIEARKNNFQWGASVHPNIELKDFKIQFDFQYSSSENGMQQSTGANIYADASLRYYMMNRKLSLVVLASDIFNTRNLQRNYYSENFNTINNLREKTRIITLSISYYLQSKEKDILDSYQAEIYGDDF